MAVIYKATNTKNGKSYDSKWPRRQQNKSARGDCQYLHNAINREAFTWQTLYESTDTQYCLRVMEPKLIEVHDTYWESGGYNLTKGGEGKLGYKTSEETKKKISEAHKGKTVTPEQLKTLKDNARRMKEFGHSNESKGKISKALKGRIFSEDHKQNISLGHASKKETGDFYQSTEYKEKMSKACKGKVLSEETKLKISQSRLGKKFPRL